MLHLHLVFTKILREFLKSVCEWQDSNLRTPTRIDLESITFGRSVTLAPVLIAREA